MDFAVNYHNWIMEEFAPFVGKEVAEVGAGTGSFSELILDFGVKDLSLFEPSENMFPLLKKKFLDNRQKRINFPSLSPPSGDLGGVVEINNCYFENRENAKDKKFDSLFYINVLEHIKNDFAELSIAFDAIKKGGHILIFVPALSWLFSDLDRSVGHFRRYNKIELETLVKKAGFEIVKSKYFDSFGVIPWYFLFVLLKREMGQGGVSFYDKFVIPIEKTIEKKIPIPFGKNLLLVGRR